MIQARFTVLEIKGSDPIKQVILTPLDGLGSVPPDMVVILPVQSKDVLAQLSVGQTYVMALALEVT